MRRRRLPAILVIALVAASGLAIAQQTNPDGSLKPSSPLTRLFTQDPYTEYEILAPGSEAFRIKYIPETSTVGATQIENATRAGSKGEDIQVYDPRTGDPVEFTYRNEPNPEVYAIRAKLPFPVPQGGVGRVLIYKTYKDARTYMMNGEDLVWVRSLSGYRLGVVLPKGYAFISSNVAAQLSTTASGQLKLAFANPSGQANPVTIHARKTTAQFVPQPYTDMFFDDVKTLYDLGDPAGGAFTVEQTYSDYRKGAHARLDALSYLPLERLKVVDLDTAKPLATVKDGSATFATLEVPITNDRQSAHLRVSGTVSGSAAGYRVENGELLFDRQLHGLRNTVILPAGWELAGVSQSATIGTQRTPAGPRTFVALINLNAENNYRVQIRARKAS